MNFKNISIVNRDNEQNLKLSITSNSTLLKIENSINFVKKNVNSSLTVFIIKYQKLKSIFKKKLLIKLSNFMLYFIFSYITYLYLYIYFDFFIIDIYLILM